MSTNPIARLVSVGRRFTDETSRVVLTSIDLDVRPGELLALVGPSGGGKTTLLSILGALDAGYEGRAELLGQDLGALNDDQRSTVRSETIGFVFQAFHLMEHLSVAENVELALWLLPSAVPAEQARQRAIEALDSVGLAGRGEDRVGRLSGGERQRVAIARAIVNRPRLLLADEPTGNLDGATGSLIIDIFDDIRRRESPSCAVVMATHDPSVAARADRTWRLVDGRLEPEA